MNTQTFRYLTAMGIQPWQLKPTLSVAELMFITDGELADRTGQLLDAMLEAIGLERNTVNITILPKTDPSRDALEQQITRIKPMVILIAGQVAAHFLLNTHSSIEQLRSTIHYHEPQHIPCIITYHPDYLLQHPKDKTKTFKDLQLAQQLLSK